MAVSANPNTQPIYPNNPLVWHTLLTTQVNGYNPMAQTTVNPPVLLGRASESGALIEHVSSFSMYVSPPPAAGGSAGIPDPNGAYGFGLASNTFAQFYSRRQGTTELVPIIEIPFVHTQRFQVSRWGPFPIIPDPQVGLRLGAGEELYVALSKAVPAPGVWISVRGGHYSLDGKDYFGAS